ncbi:MAG: hypothetical protein MMC33_007783 [Icmadophila ericetorum]|nr:hypothetical protein [Icmadophila ericetorum]
MRVKKDPALPYISQQFEPAIQPRPSRRAARPGYHEQEERRQSSVWNSAPIVKLLESSAKGSELRNSAPIVELMGSAPPLELLEFSADDRALLAAEYARRDGAAKPGDAAAPAAAAAIKAITGGGRARSSAAQAEGRAGGHRRAHATPAEAHGAPRPSQIPLA